MEFQKLFIYLFIPYLFIYLFIYSSLYLSIYSFVCLYESESYYVAQAVLNLMIFLPQPSKYNNYGATPSLHCWFLIIRKFHILLHTFCILQWLDSMGRERLGTNWSFQILNDLQKSYSDFRGMSSTPHPHSSLSLFFSDGAQSRAFFLHWAAVFF